MNAFANALFTFLFSWMRAVVQGVWSAVASGRFARFFTWLGDSWLWVALFLCLLCTAMDYLIWLIRWRPYWVWKTKWRQFKRRLRGGNRRFDRGYDTGVGLELPPEPPRAEPSAWAEQAAFQQAQPLPAPPRYDAPPERESAYSAAGLPAEAWTPPAVSAAPENAAPYRRRRSEKHARRFHWTERFAAREEDDQAMLDGLPPAVDREQAFHAPVYPQRPPQQKSGWYPPANKRRNGN